MNFDDTPEEAAFRKEVRAVLDRLSRPRTGRVEPQSEQDGLARERKWQATKAAAGYGAITWPKIYGGRDGSPMQEVIFAQEEETYDVPTCNFFGINLHMAMPTLIAHASPELCQQHVKRALYGETVWCQLFSEPSGGSDLAAVRTRAERQPDGDWLVNGQKVWTSYAHLADFGILLARSDPERPKHAGLTYFIVDMKAPGVEVRPIRQASGNSEFNEVYFTDLRIPDSNRLGEVNGGWKVALTTLMHERLGMGGGFKGVSGARTILAAARSVSRNGQPALADGRIRERIARAWLDEQGLTLTNYRALTALSRGQTPGGEFSIGKLVAARQLQEVCNVLMDLAGTDGLVTTGEILRPGDLHYEWFWSAALRIAGGTDEIMRNIIGERVLGLPPEPRSDKAGAFRQEKAGA